MENLLLLPFLVEVYNQNDRNEAIETELLRASVRAYTRPESVKANRSRVIRAGCLEEASLCWADLDAQVSSQSLRWGKGGFESCISL